MSDVVINFMWEAGLLAGCLAVPEQEEIRLRKPPAGLQFGTLVTRAELHSNRSLSGLMFCFSCISSSIGLYEVYFYRIFPS